MANSLLNEATEARLLDLFIEEALGRSEAIERHLSQMDDALDQAGLENVLSATLRTVHSLKGASGFVQMRSIETACHWMEDILTAAQESASPIPHEKLERIKAVNYTIKYLCKNIKSGTFDDSRLLALLNENCPLRSKDRADQTRYDDYKIDDTDGSYEAEEMVRISSAQLDALLYRSTELLHTRFRGRFITDELASIQEMVARIHGNADDRPIVDMVASKLRELNDKIDNAIRILESAAGQLENEVRWARMLPFKKACDGLWKVIQIANTDLGKDIQLIVRGADVEIDRALVPNINDILRHLVRNSVDHGLERPEERIRIGKNPAGIITILAETNGDRLIINVSDDGRGIARNSGGADEHKGEAHFEKLKTKIFLPGYTTAQSVTKLSGRGVGLDIVKKTIEELRGVVNVESAHNKGTTFSINVPLSMANTRAIFITAGDQQFALETAAAQNFHQYELASVDFDEHERLRLLYEGRRIPALALTAWLQTGDGHAVPNSNQAIIIGKGDSETAILVDDVTGEREILVKPMGRRLAQLRRYSGAVSTSPGGAMMLLLNHAALIESALGIEEVQFKPIKRVLLVDDSPTVRMFAERFLRAHGYEVVSHPDGLAALEWLQCGHHADAVIADIEMPNMNGLQLTREIRKIKAKTRLPVVLVTSRDSESDRARGMKAGADAYFAKSTATPEKVRGVLQALFNPAGDQG